MPESTETPTPEEPAQTPTAKEVGAPTVTIQLEHVIPTQAPEAEPESAPAPELDDDPQPQPQSTHETPETSNVQPDNDGVQMQDQNEADGEDDVDGEGDVDGASTVTVEETHTSTHLVFETRTMTP